MTRAAVPVESARLKRLRNFLTGVVLVGVVGMAAELLLIGHTDGWYQLIPVVLLTAMAVAMAWRLARPRRLTAWVVRLLMLSSVASGLAGVILHYRGNEAFELEMYPTLSGAALVFETITGATPVLAPGSMALLGLVGLAATYRDKTRPGAAEFSAPQSDEEYQP
jgi:hypothetical protein